MSRFELASAGLRAGGAVLLASEGRPDVADLVAVGPSASAEALRLVGAYGDGPTLSIGSMPTAAMADLDPVPAIARPGGVLAHVGAIEAASDIAAMTGLRGPVLLRAVRGLGGLPMREDDAGRLARRLGVPFVTLQDVLAQRLRTERIVEEVAAAHLPTRHAADPLDVHAFRSLVDGSEHLALVNRPAGGFGPAPLVRLHSECLTGDALGSLRCDCGDQLRRALRRVSEDPQGGAVIYLRGHEGRGIGLANKIRAYALQERGVDTVDANTELGFPADARHYGVAIGMLDLLGIARVRLLSNNPDKSATLARYGITVTERLTLRVGSNPHNASYLETKRIRMGHDLPSGSLTDSE